MGSNSQSASVTYLSHATPQPGGTHSHQAPCTAPPHLCRLFQGWLAPQWSAVHCYWGTPSETSGKYKRVTAHSYFIAQSQTAHRSHNPLIKCFLLNIIVSFVNYSAYRSSKKTQILVKATETPQKLPSAQLNYLAEGLLGFKSGPTAPSFTLNIRTPPTLLYVYTASIQCRRRNSHLEFRNVIQHEKKWHL